MATGLVLVDIQNDYFPGGKMELVAMEGAARKAAAVLSAGRAAHVPVYHIKHISTRSGATFFLPGTEGVEHHALVRPANDEPVIQKHYPNSFRDTVLLEALRGDGVDTVVICGAMSHMCIDATTRAAFDFALKCVVVEDACATRDLSYHGQTLPASSVHASFMAALSVPYATIVTSEQAAESLHAASSSHQGD